MAAVMSRANHFFLLLNSQITTDHLNQMSFKYMHQSIQAASKTLPPHPHADPRALALFLPWMANSRRWGLLSCQIPQGGDEKTGQMPRPPSTLQHFSLIPESNI